MSQQNEVPVSTSKYLLYFSLPQQPKAVHSGVFLGKKDLETSWGLFLHTNIQSVSKRLFLSRLR